MSPLKTKTFAIVFTFVTSLPDNHLRLLIPIQLSVPYANDDFWMIAWMNSGKYERRAEGSGAAASFVPVELLHSTVNLNGIIRVQYSHLGTI